MLLTLAFYNTPISSQLLTVIIVIFYCALFLYLFLVDNKLLLINPENIGVKYTTVTRLLALAMK